MDAGLIGGIIGGIIGLIGGILGTYLSIKNTKGPRERAFAVKAAIILWFAVVLFLTLQFTLPSPYDAFLWIPYAILLPLGITYGNRAHQRIQKEEAEKPETQQ